MDAALIIQTGLSLNLVEEILDLKDLKVFQVQLAYKDLLDHKVLLGLLVQQAYKEVQARQVLKVTLEVHKALKGCKALKDYKVVQAQ